MKLRKIAVAAIMVCCLSAGSFTHPDLACAKELTSEKQAGQKALGKVKNATVTEVDTDDEDGTLIYEVELVKGTKEYKLAYRAADGKLVAYEWEEQDIDRSSGQKLIGEDKCRELADRKVGNAKITSIVQKYDDGTPVYKVKMRRGNKKFKLKFHAQTGQLIEFEWELTG